MAQQPATQVTGKPATPAPVVTAAKAKLPREEKSVKMSDGRTVIFVGKRRLIKETLIDESKITLDKDSIILGKGAVAIRCDFVNGETRTWTPPLALIPKSVGHGLEQKAGDETAGADDVDDCVVAVDSILAQLDTGEWTSRREGDGFAGASIVIRAIMEVSGKDQETVKKFLQGKLDAAEAKGEKLTRKELYDSFRKAGTKTGIVVARLEAEKLAKTAKVDANAAMAELGNIK